jgi:hypothetical protein
MCNLHNVASGSATLTVRYLRRTAHTSGKVGTKGAATLPPRLIPRMEHSPCVRLERRLPRWRGDPDLIDLAQHPDSELLRMCVEGTKLLDAIAIPEVECSANKPQGSTAAVW